MDDAQAAQTIQRIGELIGNAIHTNESLGEYLIELRQREGVTVSLVFNLGIGLTAHDGQPIQPIPDVDPDEFDANFAKAMRIKLEP